MATVPQFTSIKNGDIAVLDLVDSKTESQFVVEGPAKIATMRIVAIVTKGHPNVLPNPAYEALKKAAKKGSKSTKSS